MEIAKLLCLAFLFLFKKLTVKIYVSTGVLTTLLKHDTAKFTTCLVYDTNDKPFLAQGLNSFFFLVHLENIHLTLSVLYIPFNHCFSLPHKIKVKMSHSFAR